LRNSTAKDGNALTVRKSVRSPMAEFKASNLWLITLNNHKYGIKVIERLDH